MSFMSLQFAAFVTICIVVYYLLPLKYRWLALFFANFVFYHAFGRRRLACMLLSALSAWLCAIIIGRAHQAEKQVLSQQKELLSKEDKNQIKRNFKNKRRIVLWLFVLLNLGMLLGFKFYPMAAASLSVLPKLNLLVPVGISFYTLQVLSYVIDIYNKKITPEKNPLKVILFTMYFPQIIEGPISRFDQISWELFNGNRFSYDNLLLGIERVLWGLFKKLVIADRLYIAVAHIFDNYTEYFGFEILLGAILYTFQLYADFSGGIDIALGVSQMFGVHLPENFKSPFFSKNIPEFWRRWHITLGTWLRDYVFYPITFSKPLSKLTKWLSKHVNKWAGKWIPSYLALLILWFCNGLWHGEGLQYIAFGLYHGFLVIIGMSFSPLSKKLCAKLRINTVSCSWKIFSILRTFLLVCIGELIFRSSSVEMAAGMLINMFSKFNPYALTGGFLSSLGLNAFEMTIALAAICFMMVIEHRAQKQDLFMWVKNAELPIRWCILFAGIAVIALFGAYGPMFVPAPFIYFQF